MYFSKRYSIDKCWQDMEAFQRLDDTVLELLKLASNDFQPIEINGVKIKGDSNLANCLKVIEERRQPKFVIKHEVVEQGEEACDKEIEKIVCIKLVCIFLM